jgi:Protein of unknown function (DUF3987)
LTSAISDGEIMGGFVNRFLCVDGISTKDIPFTPQPSPDASRHFIEQLNKVIDLCSSPVEMNWSAGAQTLFEEFYCAWRERQRSRSGETAAITNRITDHVVKIGMVYSVSEEQTEMTDDAIARAIQIGEYLERTAVTVFGDTGLSKQGRVEQMIINRLKANGGMMEYRELQRALGSKADGESFIKTIRTLQLAEQIKVTQKTTTQPRMVVYLGD